MTAADSYQDIGESTTEPVDSILVVSFGGPEQPDDVMPFLRNVTRGRNVPDERLAVVAEQYAMFGGRSPINDQVRRLIVALQRELAESGPDLPVYWGNRNWDPFLDETVQQMALDGKKHAVAFVTAAYSSYSSCRQYSEDIASAIEAVGERAPKVTKVRQYFNDPGFIEPLVDNTRRALDQLPADARAGAHIVFTAHSIPMSMANTSRYQSQLLETSRLIAERIADGITEHPWQLVFQSRSGSPHVPWLEPDVNDHLTSLSAKGVDSAVLVPIGFVSDHMEVVYDLDTQAKATADRLGMSIARAATVGTDPRFIKSVAALIRERIDRVEKADALGDLGPAYCLGATCCSG